MPQPDQPQQDDLSEMLQSVRKRLGRLTVAVMLLILAVLLSTAVVFGQLVNWFAGEALLRGGVAVGAALAGFIVGFIAGRRV
jgi:membrane associated rhomboid family serine protease